MNEEMLVSRVRELGGFAGRAEAMRAIRGTVVALGERLRDDERASLARELPRALVPALERCAYLDDFDRDELFARVARHEAVAMGFAIEHAEIVCAVLGELLRAEARTRLEKELGPSIATLFAPPAPVDALPRTTSTAGTTLASGREGSRRPLSEAHADRAHAHSVARSSDPHGDTKLSSARGLSQERAGETLAAGHPGSHRPIAGNDEE